MRHLPTTPIGAVSWLALGLFAVGCGSCAPWLQASGESAKPAERSRDVPVKTLAGLSPVYGALDAKLVATDSDSVHVTWTRLEGATKVEIWLSPEPPVEGRTDDARVRDVELPGTATEWRVERLAAGTDVFVHIVAHAADATQWGVVHARTRGGPGAKLRTGLREVYGYGPRTLALVLTQAALPYEEGELTGDLGPQWQAGTWSVRRQDGSVVPVGAVHRRSLPVGQPSYQLGYAKEGSRPDVSVDHHIFLELADSIGSREFLTVTHAGEGATKLNVRVPFSDRYLETPLIQVNQLGYYAEATRRWAYVSGWMGDGGPVDPGKGPQVARVVTVDRANPARRVNVLGDLPLTLRNGADTDTGGPVYEIDLAKLPAAEDTRYWVQIDGVGVSRPTGVNRAAARSAFRTTARALFHNRWCGDLDAKYTQWSRPAAHCEAYFIDSEHTLEMFPADTPKTGLRALRGGHHDAGDFDIRPYHVLVAQYLLRTFEQRPESFTDGQLDLPESGNGIPDLLDEALWSLAAWQQLQKADGSIASGVESHRHPWGVYYAHEDPLPYWTHGALDWHTAYVAGLFAQAAHLVQPFDATRADALEHNARRALDWALSQKATGAYVLYAAGELYRLTGEARYARLYEQQWATQDKWGGGAFDHMIPAWKLYPGSFKHDRPTMADYTVGYARAPKGQAAIQTTTVDRLAKLAQDAATYIHTSPRAHRNLRPEIAPDWGHATSQGRYLDAVYAYTQLAESPANQELVDAASLAADYMLGCNPASASFITGMGSRYPQQPLHLDSLAANKARGMDAVPGFVVYGPVENFPAADYYRPVLRAFHPPVQQQPPGLRFADARGAVTSAEFTVWETQAPTVELFGFLLARQNSGAQGRDGGTDGGRGRPAAHQLGRPRSGPATTH